MATEDELLARLDAWLSNRPEPASLADILGTRDLELLAAFILQGFRAAAKEAVLSRMEYEGKAAPFAAGRAANPALRIFCNLAQVWDLSESEQLALLGLGTADDLESLRGTMPHELPVAVIERIVILLDIFQAINTLLPASARADAWVRAANRAPLLNGRSALDLMCENLDGLRQVRRYLQAEIWAAR